MSANRFFELHNNIKLRTTPNAPDDVPHIQWVMEYVGGRTKMPVRVVSIVNIAGTYEQADMTLAVAATGALVIDGVPLVIGDRLLLAGQTNGWQNGIYVVTNAGNADTQALLTRAGDFNSSGLIASGVSVNVNNGTNYANSKWRLMTEGDVILGTTYLEWAKVAETIAVQKYVEVVIGDNLATMFAVVHNLGTEDLFVSVTSASTRLPVFVAWEIVDSNSIALHFDREPSSADIFRVIVQG